MLSSSMQGSGFRCELYMGVSENRGPKYGTPNSRILIIIGPQDKVPPNIRKLPYVHSCYGFVGSRV